MEKDRSLKMVWAPRINWMWLRLMASMGFSPEIKAPQGILRRPIGFVW
jgi:hypothetical protein